MVPATMRFSVLGTLRVHHHGHDVTPSGRLGRSLLAILLARGADPVSADELARCLWPEATDHPAARLHLLVHRLRATLDDPNRLRFDQGGYSLRTGPGEVDTADFLAACARVEDATVGTTASVESARTALRLWRGPPLADIDVPELEPHRAALAERHAFVLGVLFRSELALGHHEAIIAELAEATADAPFNEHLAALYMNALWRSGRQCEALAHYRHTRDLLIDDLGIDPGAELSALHEQILQGEQTPALAPPQSPPPPLPHRLHGRDRELAALATLVGAADPRRTQIIVLTGTAGVGKTALALSLANRVAGSFSAGYLFADLRGFSSDAPLAPTQVLATLIHSLGGHPCRSPGLDERRDHLRSLVGGRRMLILLDNARTCDQVRPVLAAASGSLILLTSRDSLPGLAALDGADVVDLGRLPIEESFDLLAEAAGEWIRDDPDALTLIERCARLPLALRIAAERVRFANARPATAADLRTVLTRLADDTERLDVLDLGGDPHTDVRAVLSWSYEALPEGPAHVFRALGLVPGRAADVYDIAVLAGLDLRQTRRHLDVLLRSHLVDLVPGQWFVQHDLLHSYAKECADQALTAAERAAAGTGLLRYYRDATAAAMSVIDTPGRGQPPANDPGDFALPTFEFPAEAVAWLDAERVNILTLVRASTPGDGPTVCALAATLTPYLESHGHLLDATDLNEIARAHAVSRRDGRAEGRAQTRLATVLTHNADIDGARTLLTGARRLAIATGDRAGEAAACHALGEGDRLQGKTDAAVGWCEAALAINRDRGCVTSQARNLATLASCLVDLDQPDRAAWAIAAARTLLQPHDAGGLHTLLAQVECELLLRHDRPEEAGRLADEWLTVSRRRGDALQVGHLLHLLGAAEHCSGRDEAAALTLEHAAMQARRTGAIHLLARTQVDWGLCVVDTDPAGATAHFEAALEIATRSGFRRIEAAAREHLAPPLYRTLASPHAPSEPVPAQAQSVS